MVRKSRLVVLVSLLTLVFMFGFLKRILSESTSMASNDEKPTMEERFVASMVLSGVGDALGYKNGEWEFCHSGSKIHEELRILGGVNEIKVNKKDWMVSDDTVMHIATANALVKEDSQNDQERLYSNLANEYKLSMHDMNGRAPGDTCMSVCYYLKPGRPEGYKVSFNPRGGGCGAAMRAMCIGLRYPHPSSLDDLIRVSVESGRMTHHHPTGYLGALAGALFVSYSIQQKPLREWGAGLMDTLLKAKVYVGNSKHEVQPNMENWNYFTDKWQAYLKLRNLATSSDMQFTDPVFPQEYGVKDRDVFYKSLSYSGWAGSSGHDAPMIAYDALLSSSLDWVKLCSRSMFHSGDSDSTGVIAGACYGAMRGFNGVSPKNHKGLEYRDRLELLGRKLYGLAYPDGYKSTTEKAVAEMIKDAPSPPADTPETESMPDGAVNGAPIN